MRFLVPQKTTFFDNFFYATTDGGWCFFPVYFCTDLCAKIGVGMITYHSKKKWIEIWGRFWGPQISAQRPDQKPPRPCSCGHEQGEGGEGGRSDLTGQVCTVKTWTHLSHFKYVWFTSRTSVVQCTTSLHSTSPHLWHGSSCSRSIARWPCSRFPYRTFTWRTEAFRNVGIPQHKTVLNNSPKSTILQSRLPTQDLWLPHAVFLVHL